MSLNYEVDNYKINRINELIRNYNANRQNLTNAYNSRVISINNNRNLGVVAKRVQISNLTITYNANIKQLNLSYNASLSKINSFVVDKINVVNKKALLVGINNYANNNKLGGCINDVNDVKDKLKTMGYNNNNIKTILDASAVSQTIIAAFNNLLTTSVSGDLLFFQYSGHGSYQRDVNLDEYNTDCDQAIVDVSLNYISDDVLKNIINNNLKPGVTLFALFDSCFSGSILDLRYQYMDSLNGNNYIENLKETETIGNVIMISGCTDMQTSADAFINNVKQGAMTWSFLKTLNDSQNIISWRQLLTKMRRTLMQNGFNQIPQISSGKIMELDSNVFI